MSASLYPNQSHLSRGYWTTKSIVRAIQDLQEAHIPLNAKNLKDDESPATKKLLHKITGKHIKGLRLYQAGRKYFGSWNEALLSSGLDPKQIRRDGTPWSQDRIIKVILALESANVPLNQESICKDRSDETAKIILNTVGFQRTGTQLWSVSGRLFGSWARAIRASGLESKNINRSPRFWTKDLIITAISLLYKKGVCLNAGKLGKDSSISTKKILFDLIGVSTNGKALYRAALKRFDTWDSALRAAEVNPSEVRRIRLWDPDLIKRSINQLRLANTPLNCAKIGNDKTARTTQHLFKVTGRRTTGRSLYQTAKIEFGTWDDALRASGLDPCQIRLIGCKTKKDSEQIIRLIRILHEAGIPLNRSSLIQRSKIIKTFTCKNLNEVISGHSIVQTAIEKLGSWDEALRSTKLNPEEIRLKSRRTSNLSIMPHQVEWVKETGGRLRKHTYFGEPTKTAEQLLQENEDYHCLQKAIRGLSSEDQNIIEGILSSNMDFGEYDKEIKSGLIDLKHLEIRFAKIISALRISLRFTKEMEELHQILFRHFPQGSAKTILNIQKHLESLDALIEKGDESLVETGQTTETIQICFTILFSAEKHFPGVVDNEAKLKIIDCLGRIKNAIDLNEESSTVKRLTYILREHCIDYSQKFRRDEKVRG